MSKAKITYPIREKSEFINELRKSVKDYFAEANISVFGNSNLFIKGLIMFTIYLVPLILMLTGVINNPIVMLICWIIMGAGVAGIGMGLMHDANHGSFSANPKLNRFLGKSLYLLGGFPPNWRYQHNTMHHGYTNIEGHDEDIAPAQILRFSPHRPLRKIHRFQHLYAWFFYGLMTFSWVTMKDFKQLIRYSRERAPLNNSQNYNRLMLDLLASKFVYYAIFLVLPIWLLPVPWYQTLLGFLLMHFVAGLILGTIFQTAHVVPSSVYPLPDEKGNLDNNWAIHQLLTTANFAPGSRLLFWLVGGLNHQIEHHLFPYISHVHYRRIAPLVQALAIKHNLPYYQQGRFLHAVRNHYRMLKSLGSPAG